MKAACVIVALSLSTGLAAQQPVVRTTLSSDVTGPAHGWALASDVDSTVDLRPFVEGHGPGVRIATPAALSLIRPAWSLSGTFTVRALFQRTPTSAASAAYGLTLGFKGTEYSGLAFLVRPDDTFAIKEPGALSGSGTWTPMTALRPSTSERPSADRLEVRIRAGEAEFLVNGKQVAVMPIEPGALDGRPGVHVAANGEILVAAFAVEGPKALVKVSGVAK